LTACSKSSATPKLEGDAQLKQRRTAIVTVANEIFDFGEMAKQSLGQFWAQRTLAERREFVHLFTRVVQHSYISKVDQRGVGKMTVQGEVVDGEYAVVRTKLPLSLGREIPIDSGCTAPTTAGGCMTSTSRG
jgi:phospholipid transport system substrate-binding protein